MDARLTASASDDPEAPPGERHPSWGMPALLPPERVLQEPQRVQMLVPLALGGSGLGQTQSPGADFATLPVPLCPAAPPLRGPAVRSGANLDVTSGQKTTSSLHCLAAPQKVKCGISMGPCNATPGRRPKGSENRFSGKNLHMNIHNSIIHNNQNYRKQP